MYYILLWSETLSAEYFEKVSHWNFKKLQVSFIYSVPENDGGSSARHLVSVTALAVYISKMSLFESSQSRYCIPSAQCDSYMSSESCLAAY